MDPSDGSSNGTADGNRADTRGRIIRSISWLLASRLFNALASLFYLAAMTRSLTPTEFGTFAIILATAQLIYGLLDFNTWQIMVQYGTAHRLRGDRHALGRLVLFCMCLEGMCGLVAMTVVLVGFGFLADHMGWTGGVATTAFWFIFLFQLCFRSTASGMLRVGEYFGDAAIAEGMMPSLRLVGALSVAFFAPSLQNFMIVWFISEAATAAAHWILALRRFGTPPRENPLTALREVPKAEDKLWHFALITNLGAVFSTASQQIVTVSTGVMLGPIAAGLFRIGYQLGQAMARLVEIISRTLYTEFSLLWAAGRHDDLRNLLNRTNRIALVSGVILMTVLLLFGRQGIDLFAGDAYEGAYMIVILMGTAALAELVCATYQAALTATRRATTVLIVRTAATATLLATLYPLVRHLEADGAAAAILLSSLVALCGLLIAMRRQAAR
ncbi:MAG: lipopolysaccharide biosynthesis protein [Sphingobium sp.]